MAADPAPGKAGSAEVAPHARPQKESSHATGAQGKRDAPPEQLAGVELFHGDKCDEAVPPLRLHPVKAPARYTFNHEVLIDVLEDEGRSGRTFFLPLDRVQRHVVPCRRHGPARRRNPIVAQVRGQICGELGCLGRLACLRNL